MFYVLVYDIASVKRLPRVLKTCRKFLYWIQNSVFEGELTRSQYLDLKIQLTKVINKKEDSIIFYAIRNPQVVDKQILGKEKNEVSNFI